MKSAFTCDLGHIFDDVQLLRELRGGKEPPPRNQENPDQRKVFRLAEQQWATHIAVIGPTGQGKSRLLWQMMREHRRRRRGFCSIDVGDLNRDFLADCAAEVFKNGNHALLKKLHYVKLGFGQVARYDPFKFKMPEGIHPELWPGAFLCWRHTRVQSLLRVCQANTTGSADFLNQPRRHRVMTNAFMALATEVERKRLSIEDVFIFFNPAHKDHKRVLDRVADLLPSEIRDELELLGGFRRLEDLRREVESSINSCRMVLGEGMKVMLSGTGSEPCLDIEKIVDQGGYLLVDAQDNAFVGHEENVALASLMAMDYVEEHQKRPKHRRRHSTLFVDETPELLGPLAGEIGRWLRILRKYGLTCCLSFQDLQSMRRDDFDLAPTVLSQSGTIVCFRSRWPDDTEILARVLLRGNLDFTPLVHEVERHGGHQFLQIDEVSESVKQDVGRSNTNGTSLTNGTNQVQSATRAAVVNWADGTNRNEIARPNGEILTEGQGTNRVRGGSQTTTAGDSLGTSQSTALTQSQTDSETSGWSVSVGHRIVPLPIVVRELQKTGQLESSIPDQEAKQQTMLHGLEQRCAVVLAPGMKQAALMETMEVRDPFVNPDAQERAVQKLLGLLHETHDYYYQPSFHDAEQQARVAAFIAGEPSAHNAIGHDTDTAPAGKRCRNGQAKNPMPD